MARHAAQRRRKRIGLRLRLRHFGLPPSNSAQVPPAWILTNKPSAPAKTMPRKTTSTRSLYLPDGLPQGQFEVCSPTFWPIPCVCSAKCLPHVPNKAAALSCPASLMNKWKNSAAFTATVRHRARRNRRRLGAIERRQTLKLPRYKGRLKFAFRRPFCT